MGAPRHRLRCIRELFTVRARENRPIQTGIIWEPPTVSIWWEQLPPRQYAPIDRPGL